MTDQPKVRVRSGNQEWVGWLQSEVSVSLEAIAGTFSIPVDLVPGQPPQIKRQDSVQVLIGDQVVIDGYVLAAEPFYGEGDCGLRVTGRDRTGDFVRSTALFKGGQWRNAKLDRIVKDLASPFGIEVKSNVEMGAPLQDFKLNLGESCLDAISRAARLRGILVVPDGSGRLLLTKAGTSKAPGEIRRGHGVIAMTGIGSDEHRHSEYIVYGQGAMAGDFEQARQIKAKAKDAEVKRYCPLMIGPDGNNSQADLQGLVDHAARVRRGHAYGFRYTMEGWLMEGKPWPLNARVPIYDDIAGLDGDEWLICSVTQTCSLRGGAVTVLEVRPIEAYDTVPLKTKVKHRKADRSRGRDGARVEPRK